jgi:hypothetical protein
VEPIDGGNGMTSSSEPSTVAARGRAQAPWWAQRVHAVSDYLTIDFLGGPRPLKFAWVIDFQKVGTFVLYGFLLWYYHQRSIAAWIIAGGDSIRKTFAAFKKNGRGVFIFLRDGTVGVPVNIAGMERPDSETKRTREWREIGLGARSCAISGSPRSACARHGR